MKRFCLLVLVFVAGILSAQQLTSFAVVDLPRIYTVFYRDSKAVRDLEERSARVQADIDRMSAEIQSLEKQRAEIELAGDLNQSAVLSAEIFRKTDILQKYYQATSTELEEQRRTLAQSASFLQQVYDEIKNVAESEGYYAVLTLKESTGILWHSPTIDITDLVIQNLMTKAGR